MPSDAEQESERLLVLGWRVTALENQQKELRAQVTAMLEEQRLTSDTALHQAREELHRDYLTADQTHLTFLTRDDLRRQTHDHRDYILYLVAIGQLALGVLLLLH